MAALLCLRQPPFIIIIIIIIKFSSLFLHKSSRNKYLQFSFSFLSPIGFGQEESAPAATSAINPPIRSTPFQAPLFPPSLKIYMFFIFSFRLVREYIRVFFPSPFFCPSRIVRLLCRSTHFHAQKRES
ncbi:hypothetical protein ABB37_07588 [Leptomonas pyrrhocoris]|uniref:Uncharacterized protein n=1 Tax=Leptomonas pyrrhocoris TaxID=157538 RepID=A0A0M9FV83_LEPPY|nr:hypothetical protein ABB37_07588 [Leptomonas pyrrhocoris]XP_015655203.1 hypothetical protein ABB37_07588 [Leptomonas pyrrhocoris]XP_015655204.1 hypothetical protein ABB37_07588 [Leptomonas pyrrhocoris]KPA76763.1 hypothetical protein ABB37_07588 [Leptomonas pyrrhocoris]KPA76764.1 hypothetical protein ABB37_07588 [Leptomonas pyrrhocoris]KPA76765.1 hypothetical protein ABB37_07588 [Leptomonas pyrrhocoris]|eukprot:XP_015655202.1 hypothetical protein ABB37_07588 [Leptomonas pyrrhocoris]